jgi:hypothetical protein
MRSCFLQKRVHAFGFVQKSGALFSLFAVTVAIAGSGCLPQDTLISVPAPSTSPSPVPPSYASFQGLQAVDTVGATKLRLSWDASTDETVYVYNVYDMTVLSAPVLIRSVPAPASFVTLSSLTPQTEYTYRVRAMGSQGEDGNNKIVSGVTYGGIISATVLSSTSAQLLFNAAANADLIQINCKNSTSPTYAPIQTITDVSQTTATLLGLVNGTSYTCQALISINGQYDDNTVTVTFTPIGQATQLVFTVQPASGTAGVVLGTQPVVTILDAQNNVVSAGPDSTTLVTLTVSAQSPTIGTIRGTASVNAVKGVATFNGINFQEAGGKIVTATKGDTSGQQLGSGILTVDSTTFTISPGPVAASASTISVAPPQGSTAPLVANGNAAYTVTIVLSDQYGNVISGVKPTFASTGSADTLSQPLSATDSTGTTTGSVSTTVAGTKTLNIVSPAGLTAVTTQDTFVAGTATKLAYLQQPTTSPAGPGGLQQIQVAIEDANGNVVTTGSNATATVVISIFNNPGGGTLTGTATENAVAGIATFNGLGISKIGTGYKLVADSAPLSLAFSNSFNISAGVPEKVSVTGPTSVISGNCSTALTIQLQDSAGNSANAPANTQINLGGLGQGQLFTSNSCAGSPVSSSVTFSSGSSTKTFYLKDNTGEAITVTASDPSNVLAQGTLLVDVNPDGIALTGPAAVLAGGCSTALLVTTSGNDGNSGKVWANTTFQISGLQGTSGELHAKPDCSDAALNPSALTALASTSITTLYYLDKKSETVTLSVADPSGIMNTTSPGLAIASVSSNISFTGPSSVVAGQCSTAYTITLLDADGNLVAAPQDTHLTISGLSTHGAFYATAACNGSALGATAVVPQNNATGTIYFLDNNAETLNLQITDPTPGTDTTRLKMASSQTISMTVSPSAFALTLPNPATIPTNGCTTAITLTTLDGVGNPTGAVNPITAVLSGAGPGGNFYSDSGCTTVVPSSKLTFATGVSVRTFYFMGTNPATSTPLSIVATDQAGILHSASGNLAVTPAPGWIGTSSYLSWFTTGKQPVVSRFDAAQSALDLHFDSSGRYLFVVDAVGQKVLKYDYLNQQYIGWIGYFNNGGNAITGSNVPGNPTLAAQCASQTTAANTPGWCTGGTAAGNGNTSMGGLYWPTGVTDDGTSVYVVNYDSSSISKFDFVTGAFEGWVGLTTTTPPSSGQLATCGSTTANTVTQGWCLGGTTNNNSVAYKGDGTMYTARAIAIDQCSAANPCQNGATSPHLYVAVQGNVLRYDAASGAFLGWIGWVNTNPTGAASDNPSLPCASTGSGHVTPGWCRGGATVSVNPQASLGGFDYPGGIYADTTNNLLWVTDVYYSTVAKYNLSTGQWLQTFTTLQPDANSGANKITSDGTSLYIADTAYYAYPQYNNRIVRMDPGSGVITGWIGKVGTAPTASGAGNSLPCNTLVINSDTPGWCLGGASRGGLEEGALLSPVAVAVDGQGGLLTGEGGPLGALGQPGKPGVKKWNITTGAYEGTMGMMSNAPTTWSADPTNIGQGNGYDDASFYSPAGMYIYSGFMYVIDQTASRIKKIDLTTGTVAGWIGGITSSPTGGASGCAGANAMGPSPGWCLGAFFAPWVGYIAGAMMSPYGNGIMGVPTSITGDGTYLYTTDYNYSRVQRWKISDGTYQGWIGGIGLTPTGCTPVSNTGGGQSSGSGWCLGGQSSGGQTNNGNATWTNWDGYLYNPSGITYTGGNLYVVDNGQHRVVKFNASTGQYLGWIGRVSTNPTGGCTPVTLSGYKESGTGWCTGGTSQNAANGPDPGGGFYFYNGQDGITTDGTYLYITNFYNSRIDKFSINGAFVASVQPRWDTNTNLWVTNPAGLGYSGVGARGLSTDGTYLYGTVSWGGGGSPDVVFKRNLSDGSLVGSQGEIASQFSSSIIGGSTPSCIGATGYTPGWCTTNNYQSFYIDGYTLMKWSGNALYTAVDSNFVYVGDQGYHRVTRMPK